MNTKNILSAFALLALVIGPMASLAAEPKTHDHQATKGIIMPKTGKKETDKDCEQTQSKASKVDSGKESQTQDTKCKTEKKSTQTHDHRKMKNL